MKRKYMTINRKIRITLYEHEINMFTAKAKIESRINRPRVSLTVRMTISWVHVTCFPQVPKSNVELLY